MNPVPLQQSPEFARALAAYGADVAQTAPVVLRRALGPLGHIAFASRAHPQDVASTDIRLLNGETPCPEPYRALGFRQIITPVHIAEWNLCAPDLRAGLHGKWRNRLLKGEASGLRLRIAPWDGSAHWLLDRAQTMARARKYRCYPTALLSAYAQLNPDRALIIEAYDRGTPVAACLVLRHGVCATYHCAWSSATGHALNAPRVVLWHAATHLAKRGHTILDLGTVETDHAPGLARFKLGTGATLRALGGTWVRLRAR